MGLNPKKETFLFQMERKVKKELFDFAQKNNLPATYVINTLIKGMLSGKINFFELVFDLNNKKKKKGEK